MSKPKEIYLLGGKIYHSKKSLLKNNPTKAYKKLRRREK